MGVKLCNKNTKTKLNLTQFQIFFQYKDTVYSNAQSGQPYGWQEHRTAFIAFNFIRNRKSPKHHTDDKGPIHTLTA